MFSKVKFSKAKFAKLMAEQSTVEQDKLTPTVNMRSLRQPKPKVRSARQ